MKLKLITRLLHFLYLSFEFLNLLKLRLDFEILLLKCIVSFPLKFKTHKKFSIALLQSIYSLRSLSQDIYLYMNFIYILQIVYSFVHLFIFTLVISLSYAINFLLSNHHEFSSNKLNQRPVSWERHSFHQVISSFTPWHRASSLPTLVPYWHSINCLHPSNRLLSKFHSH